MKCKRPELVPHVSFVDIPQHMEILKDTGWDLSHVPIVGVYIPIIRIPIKGGMTIHNIATFDHGTHELKKKCNFFMWPLQRSWMWVISGHAIRLVAGSLRETETFDADTASKLLLYFYHSSIYSLYLFVAKPIASERWRACFCC